MRIFISDNTKKAMKTLEIDEFPFTEKLLKTHFKRLISINHPDKNNGSEESKKKSQQILHAYNILKNLAISEPTETQANIIQEKYKKEKEDIFTFWERCETCKGTGKIVDKNHFMDTLYYQLGRKRQEKYRVATCYKCGGRGEVKLEVFNPVIPKGGVMI